MENFKPRQLKAVIPVAGWGARSLPATKTIPKEMLPVYNKPVIQHVAEEAQATSGLFPCKGLFFHPQPAGRGILNAIVAPSRTAFSKLHLFAARGISRILPASGAARGGPPLLNGPLRAGLISSLTEETPLCAKGKPLVLKSICWPLEDSPPLPEHLLALLLDLASRQCAMPGGFSPGGGPKKKGPAKVRALFFYKASFRK